MNYWIWMSLLMAGCFDTNDPSEWQDQVDALEAENGELQVQLDDALARLDTLETYLEIDTENHTVSVVGANFMVKSGAGATDAEPNGLGNLIVGYDEADESSEKTGSHNLIAGTENSYTSYGGVVFGLHNVIAGPFASALGGSSNTVTDDVWHGVVVGGTDNISSGNYGVCVGGRDNDAASGQAAVVVGGTENTADANESVIVGGRGNQTTGSDESVVVGGSYNTATHKISVVLGGDEQTSTGNTDISPWPE